MEVISSFELDRTVINLSEQETINFHMFGEEHLMSYNDFFVRMGLVYMEYAYTESYSQLYIDLLVHQSHNQVWTQILRGRKTYICDTQKTSA